MCCITREDIVHTYVRIYSCANLVLNHFSSFGKVQCRECLSEAFGTRMYTSYQTSLCIPSKAVLETEKQEVIKSKSKGDDVTFSPHSLLRGR